MTCPFRHDIECNECDVYIQNIPDTDGFYSSCAITEIALALMKIAERGGVEK